MLLVSYNNYYLQVSVGMTPAEGGDASAYTVLGLFVGPLTVNINWLVFTFVYVCLIYLYHHCCAFWLVFLSLPVSLSPFLFFYHLCTFSLSIFFIPSVFLSALISVFRFHCSVPLYRYPNSLIQVLPLQLQRQLLSWLSCIGSLRSRPAHHR